jgi:molecular chaperone GrpE
MTTEPEAHVPQNDAPSAEASSPETELLALQTKYAALEEEFLRFRAEAENQRKRTLKDAESARKFGAERLLGELLPVVDTLVRGVEVAQSDKASIEALKEGKEATLRLLSKVMEGHGVKELNPQGEIFNPELHQAISVQADAQAPANTVMSVVQRGYVLHERLLRPALVVVSGS